MKRDNRILRNCALWLAALGGCGVAQADSIPSSDTNDVREEASEAARRPLNGAQSFSGSNDPQPWLVDPDELWRCTWQKETESTETYLYVQCPYQSQNPIAGSCNNDDPSAKIQGSMPFENGDLDFPENGEDWEHLADFTGWRCKKSGTAGTLTGVALCCGQGMPQ
jgi:hypothetical protein